MAEYQIAFNLATFVATVQTLGDALPAGSKKIGEFEHADVETSLNDLEFDVNHVLTHHVRDALYHTSAVDGERKVNLVFPNNITDLAKLKIVVDTEYVALTGVSSTPATVSLANGATQQITNTFTPTNASNKSVVYTTSNAAVAQVSQTGLITAGATDGTATITITTDDGDHTDTVVVTVA